MITVEEFERRLEALDATHSQRRLARLVADEPEHVAMSTAGALADELGINQSTISRFTIALGLKGYGELRALCRQMSGRRGGMLQRFLGAEQLRSADPPDSPAAGRDRLASQDRDAIARSFATIDEGDWSQAADLLASCARVGVAGLRQSHPVAAMASYLLSLVRADVLPATGATGVDVDALGRLGDGDCLLAIATQPCSRATVDAARWAREHGIRVIALTDERSSPLARHADCTLIAATDSDALLSSMTAMVCLVQALVNDVAARDPERTRASLSREERLLRDFGVYAPDEA